MTPNANAMKDKMGHLKKNKMKPTVKLIKNHPIP